MPLVGYICGREIGRRRGFIVFSSGHLSGQVATTSRSHDNKLDNVPDALQDSYYSQPSFVLGVCNIISRPRPVVSESLSSLSVIKFFSGSVLDEGVALYTFDHRHYLSYWMDRFVRTQDVDHWQNPGNMCASRASPLEPPAPRVS